MRTEDTVAENLLNKKSITMAQDVFFNEFKFIYDDSSKKERGFLEKSVDQIYKKYYYSVVEPDTYITPANILSALIKKDTDINDIFVPKIELLKSNGALQGIHTSLRRVNSSSHYMVDDFEKVIRICTSGIKVDENGIPDEKERKQFEGKLFINDRHYLNILILVAINTGYIAIFSYKNEHKATTINQSKELKGMSVFQKIKLITEGIIVLFVKTLSNIFPESSEFITKGTILNSLKDPSKFTNIYDQLVRKSGMDIEPLMKAMTDKGVDVDLVKDLISNDPSSYSKMLHLFIHIDIYFITPLGYYLQIIKPLYENIYNIEIELGSALYILNEDFNEARCLLFGSSMEFDLTGLGEEILLNGNKTKVNQKIPKNYTDGAFLKCFEARDSYLQNELMEYYDEIIDEEDEEDDIDEAEFLKPFTKNNKTIDISELRKGTSNSKTKGTSANKAGPAEIYNKNELFSLKIKYYYKKSCWIVVEIPGISSLDDLHEIIHNEFNLEWGHLYSFFMSGKFWDADSEYCHPDSDGNKKADGADLSFFNLNEGSKFSYVYDYGDEIRFEIECKEVSQIEKGVKYPRVIKKSKKFIEEYE